MFLLLSMPWLACAAALEPAHREVRLPASYDDLPKEVRIEIVKRGMPQLVKFLMYHYADVARIEIPDFGHGKIRISPSGSTLVFIPARRFDEEGEVIVWDLAKNKLRRNITNMGPGFFDVLVTPDGNKIITQNHGYQISVWDINKGIKLHDLGQCRGDMALSSDGSKLVGVGKFLVGADTTIVTWNVETGKKEYEINDQQIPRDSPLAISNDGAHVAWCQEAFMSTAQGGYRCHTHVVGLSMETGQTVPFETPAGKTPAVSSFNFNSAGTELLGFVNDYKRWIISRCTWNAITGKLRCTRDETDRPSHHYGNMRLEGSLTRFDLYNDEADQFLCSIDTNSPVREMTDHWYVVESEKGFNAWNLDLLAQQSNTIHDALGSCSGNQIVLLEKIFQVVVGRINLRFNKNVEDYWTLPQVIQDILERYNSDEGGRLFW